MADLRLGLAARAERSFSREEGDALASLTGLSPSPPAPSNGEVPPALIGGLFSFILGTLLPGPGTRYLRQSLDFLAVARYGEPLTAVVTIVRLRPEKGLVNLETICRGPGGRVVCRGEALVLAPDSSSWAQ